MKSGMAAKTIPATQDFQFVGGSLSLDFVNTMGNRLGEKRDYLSSPREINRWARLAGLMGSREKVFLSASQRTELLSAREELYDLFLTAAHGKAVRKSAVKKLNRRFAKVAPHRQMVPGKDGFHWTWKTSSRDPARLLAPILSDAAELLTSGKFAKIRQCAGETCGWLFLDRSQALRRRWCSMADCGNRDKVRRYYRRKAHFSIRKAAV
jgi:predicted RNA-binding Zn ribbon-like protein